MVQLRGCHPKPLSAILPSCHRARNSLARQGDTDCVPVAVSLSPVIDCHARSVCQDALTTGQARRTASGKGENRGGANNVKEREIPVIITRRAEGWTSLP